MSLASKAVDLINPVVLRESRQLVRSKFAVGILMTFLLVLVISAALYVITIGDNSYQLFTHGKNLFQILYYVLGYIGILFIPAYTAIPLLIQKQSTNMDLLMVSTIPVRSVVWGKMASAFWMMVLMFSVSMPFMVLTVLLRGIGLFEVINYLLMLATIIMLATMGFILLVCLPTSRVFVSLLSIGYLLLLLMFPGITASFQFTGLSGNVALIFLGIAAILLPIGGAIASALISPAIANRSKGVRITVTACWLVSGIVCLLFDKTDAIEVWAVLSTIGASIAILAGSSEPGVMSRRVQRAVPNNKGLRILAFPWFTGQLNAWVWSGFIALVSTLIFYDEKETLFVMAHYALMYSLLGTFIRRLTGIRRICPEKYTWAVAVFLGMVGTLLPIIAHFVVKPNSNPDLLWEFGNPFVALFDNPEEHLTPLIWTNIFLILINVRWLLKQAFNFHPPKVVESKDA